MHHDSGYQTLASLSPSFGLKEWHFQVSESVPPALVLACSIAVAQLETSLPKHDQLQQQQHHHHHYHHHHHHFNDSHQRHDAIAAAGEGGPSVEATSKK
jgi:hypothetical protein